MAERAGMSRGAAQHHFPTREALFTAAVERVGAAAVRAGAPPAAGRGRLPPSTATTVGVVFALFCAPLFRAALVLWVAAASEPALRDQVVALESRIGRDTHRMVVELLGVDEDEPGVRETVQATWDLARGLGPANLLTGDSARRTRIAAQWAHILDATVAVDAPRR